MKKSMLGISFKLKLSCIFVCLTLIASYGQFGGSENAGRGGSTAATPQSDVEPDTFDVQYFFQDNLNLLIPFSDTLLNNRFEQYDPARKRMIDYGQLGNLGTPHHPLLFNPVSDMGLDVGFHQFDLYKIGYKDLRFYITEKPFADLFFTQGPDQENTYFKARFTRNFQKRLNLSIDYKRMNNVGQFKSQEAVNTDLALGFWYHSRYKNYNAFFTYTSNVHDIDDNGGIDIENLNEVNLERVFNIPVFLRSANTYHVSRDYAFSQQYRLAQKTDTSATVRAYRSFVLGHDLLISTNKYKFSDADPPTDTIFYEHLLVDTRGLRYFIKDNSIENTFSVSTSKSDSKTQRDLLRVGLQHQIHFVEQEPVDTTINHLRLQGQWNFAPSERIKIRTKLDYNLLANIGDYKLSGDLFFDFKKAGTFQAGIINQLYSPTLVQHRMYISEQQLWKNNFDKTFATRISATYSLPHLGFSATGQYHLIDKLIYFDTLAFPQQLGSVANVLQLIINQNFKLGNIHLDNTIALQTSEENAVRIPEFFSKHNLYFEGFLFKKTMLLRLGMDLRLNSPYFANYYQPLIGQFHLQDNQEIQLYPVVDAYTSFKVKHFRFFLRTENLTQLINSDLYYQVAGYAQPYMTIKFGVSWQLLN